MSHWYDSTPKKSRHKRDSNPGSSALEADALTTRPTRLFQAREEKTGEKSGLFPSTRLQEAHPVAETGRDH